MEIKKVKRKDLESKKAVFFEVGLVVALLTTFFAFEWKSHFVRKETMATVVTAPEEIILPVIIEEPPMPDNAQPIALLTDVFEINDNPDLPPMDIVVDFNLADPNIDTSEFYREPKDEDEDPNEVLPIYDVNQKPTFKGKDANSFVTWVYSQLKYPEEAERNNIEGTVYVNFVIGKDGKLSNIRNVRSVDPLLVDEVIRVVKTSPNWEPGVNGTRKVNVSYQLCIHFKLQR